MPDKLRSLSARLGPGLVAALGLAMCAVVLIVETRANHIWYRSQLDDVRKNREHDLYHPLMNVDKTYKYYGQAVLMMLEDPAKEFWLIMKDNTLYAPVAVNHYLYPEHHVRMSEETQKEVIRYWLYGIEESIRHREPSHYDKRIEASQFYARFPDDASSEFEDGGTE